MRRHIRTQTREKTASLARTTQPAERLGQTRGLGYGLTSPQSMSSDVNHGRGQPEEAVSSPPAPSQVTFNIQQSIPVPPQGTRPLQASADVSGVTWSLHPGSTNVDPGTSIAANGTITIGAGQRPGTIEVRATNSAGAYASSDLRFCSIPTGISSTSLISDPPTGEYGHVFDHVFTSSSGNVADLENLPVGEKFPNLPNPSAAVHVISAPTYPFGSSFTLNTATLTPNATNNWFLTSSGQLGGSHDTVSIGQTGIDVGRFVQSASNPAPTTQLPAGFTVDQQLHWYNPLQANAANRWTSFVTVGHGRYLVSQSGSLRFETTVNGVSDGGDVYTGNAAVYGLTATPASIPHSPSSPGGGAPSPQPATVALSASTLPSPLGSGQNIIWSIRGNALGCTITPNAADPRLATLTVGTAAGTVTVRAAASGGANFDETSVQIT